jgi:trehalose 6-phosphate synthase/phosphatase
MEQRLALWAVSNILLITTLRDGQCLPPLEFITVKKHLQRMSKSAVILSEFSGCNRALGGVLKINPFNVDEIAKNIDIAINMSPEEKEQRLKIASNYISKHSTYRWAEAFLKDLKRSHQPCEGDGTSAGGGAGASGQVITYSQPAGALGVSGASVLGHNGNSMGDTANTSKYMILGLGLNLTLIKTR